MTRTRAHLSGLGLATAALAVWLGRDAAAWWLAAQASSLGFPFCLLLVRAAALLLGAAGAWQLRAPLFAAGQALLGRLDLAEERLEKLPPRRARAIRASAVALVVGGAVAAVFEWAYLGAYLETRAIDLFFRLRFPDRSQVELATGRELPSANFQSEVVVLALDDETIAHLGWPMQRVHYARLIDAVARARPKTLSFDVSLVDPGREHPEWDAAIGEAARRAGNVTFAFTVARTTREARPAPSEAALRLLDQNALPWQAGAARLPEYAELVGGDVAPLTVVDSVAQGARAVAMANVLLDGGDDVLRHSLVVARLGRRLLPSLSVRVAADALGVPLDAIAVHPGSHLDLGGRRRVPIDALGRTLVRYQGRHDARGAGPFRYVSLWSLLRSDATVTLTGNPMGDDQAFLLDDQARVTRDGAPLDLAAVPPELLAAGQPVAGRARFAPGPGRILELAVGAGPAPAEPEFDVLDEETLSFRTTLGSVRPNRSDVSALADKHLLVGSTALAAADVRNSPLGEMPGVEHHATMLANLLRGDFFHQSPGWANGLLVLGSALVAAALAVSLTAGVGLLLNALLVLALLLTSFLLSSSGLYVPIVGPSTAVAGTYFVSLILGERSARSARRRAEKDREFVRQTFGRYLTNQVVEKLLDSPDGLKLGGQREFVTIMMTDLRGFTSMCGTMEPERVVRLLNHYLEEMTRIIERYGGTIDEFIGDAILVVFGAPLPLDKAEARAVSCAIAMLNAMPGINAWNTASGLPEVEMGIGIHSGEVVLGNIGSELRAKYGIVGATINLTSRVESYTVGGQVLISEATRARCGELLTLGASQEVAPKGVKGTLQLHEVLAVGAPFDVRLNQATEALSPPVAPLSLRYAIVEGKAVGEPVHPARVEALSELGMELRVEQDLKALTNLQLRVVEGEGLKPGDLYGKVLRTEVRPGVVYLRLTSVPPELKPVLELARGAAAQARPQVPDSAMVTT